MTDADPWTSSATDGTGDAFPLLCLPYAGGGTNRFRAWADDLPPTVQLQLVHLPGRESRIGEEPFDRLEDLVDALCEAFGFRLPDRFGIFGHSMGALIAFGLARGLRERGMPEPTHLFVSGRRSPSLPSRHDPIRDLPRDEFVEAIGELGGLPPALLADEELLDLFLPTLRADLTLCETYEYQPGDPLDCDIYVYRGDGDEFVTEEEARAWDEVTTGRSFVRTIEGGHFFLDENASHFLEQLASDLEEGSQQVPVRGADD